jgi:hypothetical protein
MLAVFLAFVAGVVVTVGVTWRTIEENFKESRKVWPWLMRAQNRLKVAQALNKKLSKRNHELVELRVKDAKLKDFFTKSLLAQQQTEHDKTIAAYKSAMGTIENEIKVQRNLIVSLRNILGERQQESEEHLTARVDLVFEVDRLHSILDQFVGDVMDFEVALLGRRPELKIEHKPEYRVDSKVVKFSDLRLPASKTEIFPLGDLKTSDRDRPSKTSKPRKKSKS